LNPESLLVNRGILLCETFGERRNYHRICETVDVKKLELTNLPCQFISADNWESSEIVFDHRRNLLADERRTTLREKLYWYATLLRKTRKKTRTLDGTFLEKYILLISMRNLTLLRSERNWA